MQFGAELLEALESGARNRDWLISSSLNRGRNRRIAASSESPLSPREHSRRFKDSRLDS